MLAGSRAPATHCSFPSPPAEVTVDAKRGREDKVAMGGHGVRLVIGRPQGCDGAIGSAGAGRYFFAVSSVGSTILASIAAFLPPPRLRLAIAFAHRRATIFVGRVKALSYNGIRLKDRVGRTVGGRI